MNQNLNTNNKLQKPEKATGSITKRFDADVSTPSPKDWEHRIQFLRASGFEITPAIQKVIENERSLAQKELAKEIMKLYDEKLDNNALVFKISSLLADKHLLD